MAEAAIAREESRGTHFRRDFPARNDAAFCRRIFLDRADDGSIHLSLGENTAPSDRSERPTA